MSDIVERLNAAGTALTQDRPYASAACLEAAATITALREEVERLTARCSELSRWADGYGKLDADYAAADHELTALRQRVVEVVGPFADLAEVVLSEAPPDALAAWSFKSADGQMHLISLDTFRAARALVNEMETTQEVETRRDHAALYEQAINAVRALDDYTNVNETEFTGWGDGAVPPRATFWRVKSGQALKALSELADMAAARALVNEMETTK